MSEQPPTPSFADLLAEHRGLLSKVARAFAPCPADRDDVLQEIATRLWRALPGFRGESSRATFIYRVALFAALDWSARERRRSELELAADGTAREAQARREGDSDPRVDWLYARIAELSALDRALMLLLLDGFDYAAMASVLGISESNVGVRIHRVKRRLTRAAQEADPDELR